MPIKDILLLHHSHTDIGYTNYQDTVFALQRDYIRRAMYLAEKYAEQADGEQFKWTCETTIIVEDFLQHASDSEIDKLISLHKRGLIDFGGLYCNVSTLYTAEMLMRSISVAENLRQDYGLDIRYGLNCDVNGQSWGLVEMLLNAGFEGMAMAINRALAPDPQPRPMGFHWEGPSGRRLLTWHGEHYGDGNNLGIPRAPLPAPGRRIWQYDVERAYQPIQDYIASLESKHYVQDFAFLQIIGSYMWDNDGPDELLPQFVKEWNARGYQPRMRMVTLDELFARIQTDVVRTGDWTDYWAQGINSSAFETALNRHSHGRFFSVQQLGGLLKHMPDATIYPYHRDEMIWRNLARYDEHTWGSSESISHGDSIQSRGQWYKKAVYAYDAAEQITRLQQQMLRDLATRIKMPQEPHALVYNALPWERELNLYLPATPRSGWELERLERDIEIGSPQGETGNRIDYGVVKLPACGYATIPLQLSDSQPSSRMPQIPQFVPTAYSPNTCVRSHGWLLENEMYKLRVDPLTGAVNSLIAEDKEWVDSTSGWQLGQYVYETIGAVNQRDDIQLPAYDHDYDYRPHLAPQYHTVTKIVEKCFVKGVSSGRFVLRFEAQGVQDAYVQIVLYDDLPYIDFIYDINKTQVIDAESVYVTFPLAIDDPIAKYEVAGAIVETEREQLPNACRDYYPVQNWVNVGNQHHSVTLATPDVPLVHIGGFNNHRHQKKLHMEQPLLIGWAMNNHWWTNFRRDQTGWTRFRYRLMSHSHPFDPIISTRFGADMAVDALVGPLIDREPGLLERSATAPIHLEVSQSLLSIEPNNIHLISLQPTQDGVQIRLQEIAGRATDYTIKRNDGETLIGTIQPYRLQTIQWIS
ncbi:MAG: glycoside hydrolase family 38 C-terminal domain-containing protein [Chloroflexota bacterium]